MPPLTAPCGCTPNESTSFEIYSEQLRRWRNEHPDAKQRREIERLESQTSRLRELNALVLRLAAEIRKGTIDRVMEKTDLELGLEAIARARG